MTYNITQLYRDAGIQFLTEGHKHCHPGWVHTPCPFCTGNPGWHLGYNLTDGFFCCYRCGWHSPEEVVSTLTKQPVHVAKDLLSRYQLRPSQQNTPSKAQNRPSHCSQPLGVGPLGGRHLKYLRDRLFEPERLVEEYGLTGTGPVGAYKHRIIIPILDPVTSRMISYQGRDITGRSQLRYKACPAAKEVYPHQDTLYGLNAFDGGPPGPLVVVEGVTDVWRLGPRAVATFGIRWNRKQAALMMSFSPVFVMFDWEDPQARVKATELADYLSAFTETEVVELDAPDPASLDQDEADDLMKELLNA